MKIDVTRPGGFKYAFHGVDVVEYRQGVHDVPQEVADLALAEKWASPVAATPAAAVPATAATPPRGAGRRGRRPPPPAAG